MLYRMAMPTDFPAIVSFLEGTEYFNPVSPEHIGGHWIVAEHRGKICGTVWCFVEAPNCFIDYWAANGAVAATKLLMCLQKFCRTNKVTRIHGVIASDNIPALRLSTKAFDVLAATPYHRIYKELSNGAESNGTKDNHTICR